MPVGQVIIFDDVMLNDGGFYNPTTGIFTVPVKGVYAFFCTCTRAATSSNGETAILMKRNGQIIGDTFMWYDAGKDTASIGTAVANCEVGDTINTEVRHRGSTTETLLAGHYCVFNGVLTHTE